MLYLDSSALLKLVIAEKESRALLSFLKREPAERVSCTLVRTEVLRATRPARRCCPRKSPGLAPNPTTRPTRRCATRRRRHVGPGEDALPRCDPPCRRRPHRARADGPGDLRQADGRRRGASRLPGRVSCLTALVLSSSSPPRRRRRARCAGSDAIRGRWKVQPEGKWGGGNRIAAVTHCFFVRHGDRVGRDAPNVAPMACLLGPRRSPPNRPRGCCPRGSSTGDVFARRSVRWQGKFGGHRASINGSRLVAEKSNTADPGGLEKPEQLNPRHRWGCTDRPRVDRPAREVEATPAAF